MGGGRGVVLLVVMVGMSLEGGDVSEVHRDIWRGWWGCLVGCLEVGRQSFGYLFLGPSHR